MAERRQEEMHAQALRLPTAEELPARRSLSVEACYAEHREGVYRLAMRYGAGSKAFAEDVTHDAFLKLMGHLDEIDDVGAWLYRVTANVAISRLRRERSLVTILRQAWFQEERQAAPSPERELLGSESGAAALATLRRLPGRERVVVCMKILDGKSQREIAEALSMSEGYVSKLLARARRRIELEREEDDGTVE